MAVMLAFLIYPGALFSLVFGSLLVGVYASAVRSDRSSGGAGGWPGSGNLPRTHLSSPAGIAAAACLAGAAALLPLPFSPLPSDQSSALAWLQLSVAGPWLGLLARARSGEVPEPGLLRALLWSQACIGLTVVALVAVAGSASLAHLGRDLDSTAGTALRVAGAGVLLLAQPAAWRVLGPPRRDDLGLNLTGFLSWTPTVGMVGVLFSGGGGAFDLVRSLVVLAGAGLIAIVLDANARGIETRDLARAYSTVLFPAACLVLAGAMGVAALGWTG